MDKYTLLIIFNTPFVLFGIIKAFVMHSEKKLSRLAFISRLAFWLFLASGLLFAKPLYEYLAQNNLTDSTPLSLADVVLVTGVSTALFLCLRLYSRIDSQEKRLNELHQELSILLNLEKDGDKK